jgi:undecaprenyl-diphosphatase
MEELIALDKKFFLYLNGLHSSWLDPVMFLLSETYPWFLLYAFLLYLTARNYGLKSWLVLLSIVLTILLSDQIASGLFKPFFLRLRPSHEPDLESTIHLVNHYKGGLYGFASSHASNVFALATFFWLLFRQTYKGMFWLFVWASLVAYTRIYLGVHYPGDVFAGALIGILSGWIGYTICAWAMHRIQKQASNRAEQ